MALTEVTSFFGTVSSVMSYMANFAGGTIPGDGTADFDSWLSYIQAKYEETSNRGFWRRFLTKDELTLAVGDTEVYLPVRFQRSNSLYVLVITDANGDSIDLCDPDRTPDDQEIYVEMDNNPTMVVDEEEVANTYYGRWKISFKEEIETAEDALIWYWATPPKPNALSDKILLPGDLIAYGALSEHFRAANLPGSQDDARTEYENRLNTYMAMETIPGRHELLKFATNPRGNDFLQKARDRYSVRTDRTARL